MHKKYVAEWAVIGAGPAGIAAVGKLIDKGVNPKKIVWIDPKFNVGDLGDYWSAVSSNTTVKLFKEFLCNCKSFNYDSQKKKFEFDNLPNEKTCQLRYIIEPLVYITQQLQHQVNTIHDYVESVHLSESLWHMNTRSQQIFQVDNIILATGAIPKPMQATFGVETISLYDALNPSKLSKKCNNTDRVAVFGSSHSAILIIRELLDLGVKEVVNFYLNPLRFGIPIDDWVLFDDGGLKGETAIWARKYIIGKQPKGLTRTIANDENITKLLPGCTKAIYAVGFVPRSPLVENYPNYKYNPHNGIIATGLFGVGIGFPESKTDPFGNTEFRVGLWKFINYLDKVVPLWLKYGV